MVLLLYTRLNENDCSANHIGHYMKLPPLLQQQNLRFRREQDRLANLFGKTLLMEGFDRLGIGRNRLNELFYNDYGRPYIAGLGIDFNISHSGEYVLCAISNKMQLGVDIEEIKPIVFDEFKNIMSMEQWAIINGSDKPVNEFFRFWTIKESVIKAAGKGLSIPLVNILIQKDVVYCGEKKWFIKELTIAPGYSAHIAMDKANDNILMEQIFH